jgi:hypothetical protein
MSLIGQIVGDLDDASCVILAGSLPARVFGSTDQEIAVEAANILVELYDLKPHLDLSVGSLYQS